MTKAQEHRRQVQDTAMLLFRDVGWSGQRVADQLGVSRQTIWRRAKAGHPDPSLVDEALELIGER